jgi:hypothetical protein
MFMMRSWRKQPKRLGSHIKARFSRRAMKQYLFLSFFTGVFAASLPLLDYIHQDVTISSPEEVLLLCVFFVAVALSILATYSLWLRSNAERLLATSVTTYIFMEHYDGVVRISGWLRNHVGSVKSAIIAQIFLYFAVGGLAKLLYRLSKKAEHKGLPKSTLETVVKFACVTMAILNLFAFLSYTYNRHAVINYNQPKSTAGVSTLNKPQGPKRDIYYFVFDRYASSESLKSNFNFDNGDYLNWLKNSGFYIHDNAFSNYQFTAPSIASTMRMDYHLDLSKKYPGTQQNNVIPYKNLIQNSQAINLLHSSGYDVYNVGNWWNITRYQKNATNVLPLFQFNLAGKTKNLSELQSKGVDKSFLGGFLKHGISMFGITLIKMTNGAPRDIYLQQLADVKKLAEMPHSKPRVVFAHFLNTHPPYVFNADGSMPPYDINDTNAGVPRVDKYINQLKFANASTKNLLSTIQQNSKNKPIIIIQADEGPYPLGFPSKWQTAPADTLKLKFGVLSAYELPGASSEELSNVNSSVNIFRFVFNKYFNTEFKYLPDCSYVYNPEDNKPFMFYNITSKLHPADTDCEKYK